jgi:hypothetical protein
MTRQGEARRLPAMLAELAEDETFPNAQQLSMGARDGHNGYAIVQVASLDQVLTPAGHLGW